MRHPISNPNSVDFWNNFLRQEIRVNVWWVYLYCEYVPHGSDAEYVGREKHH